MKDVIAVREAAVVIRHRNRLLLCRRPPDATRWQNMWEFPHAELSETEDAAEGAARIAKELTGLTVSIEEASLTIRHTVTRHSIEMACFEAVRRAGRFASPFYSEGKWVGLTDLNQYPTGTPQRRLIDHLRQAGRQRNLF